MPYSVKTSKECPADKPWAVVKDSDGSIVGCHESIIDAEKQVKALYANEAQKK
jgi:hypothetical protein